MAKELLWSDEADLVYEWASEYESKEEFANWVKNQYEDGDCEVINIQIQPCISTAKGLQGDVVVPLALTDIVIENFYTGEVVPV